MASPTVITSSRQFDTLASSNTYVVVDFHAVWCGPCKQIAPVYEALAQEHTRAGRIAFAKVDVDGQPDVARKYGVSAMPTFLILKRSQVAETVRGANPAALRAAVGKAAADAGKAAPLSSVAFQTRGHVLGSSEGAETPARSGPSMRSWLGGGGGSWVDALVRLIGLYIVTLFSLDPRAAAESSQWRVGGPR